MKVLIIAAHPDDEVLGCGGTIPQIKQMGGDVYVLFLADGVTARNPSDPDNAIHEIQLAAKEVSTFLGYKIVDFLDFPDQKLDSIPQIEIVKSIEKVVKSIKPDIVFTHWIGDLNIDHRIAFEATLTALRPIPDISVREIYSYEVPSSTEWNYLSNFRPTTFVEISDFIDAKVKAFSFYKTEIRDYPHPRSVSYIRSLANIRGGQAGLNFAEGFETIRILKFYKKT